MQYLKKFNVLGLILVGSLSWILTMFKSGLSYPFGMGFWGPNGHDGIWHISLINSLSQGSFDLPIFSGEPIKNYHVGFDYLLALINKFIGIPSSILYFQITPIIFSLLIGFLTYKLVFLWRGSKVQAFWVLFFVYFGSGFGSWINFFENGNFSGESMFWSQQAISTLLNPPFALSLIVLLIGLIALLNIEKREKNIWVYIAVVCFGVLVQVKVYAAVLSIAGIGILTFLKFFKDKKLFLIYLQMLISIILISTILFLTTSNLSSKLLTFYPFWFLETMMALSDRVGWPKYYEAIVNYKLGNVWWKLIPAYVVAFAIFWFGNLGPRAIKEILVVKWLKNPLKVDFLEIFFATVIILGVLFPMIFVQKGTPWNTIQFLYYSLFFSGILAGITVGEIFERKNKNLKILVGVAIIVLSLPTTIDTLWNHYLPSRPPARVSHQELEALKFLSMQPKGTVLTYPFDPYKAKAAESNPPRPLYLYESTSYVSAFSKQSVFLEDEVNLEIMDYNWRERRKEIESFLRTDNFEDARSFLRRNNIKYIYWIKGQRALLGETQLGISRLYENEEVDIYKVDLYPNHPYQWLEEE